MSSRYDTARADFEALEELAELEDQVDLDAERLDLMRNPTKGQAARMYESAIQLWLQAHHSYWSSHPVVEEILERHSS